MYYILVKSKLAQYVLYIMIYKLVKKEAKMVQVIKRDGRKVDFETEKIVIAVQKAMKETEKGIDEVAAKEVGEALFEKFKDVEEVSIEEIQDNVEIELMKRHPEAAKKYILYREERAKLREEGWAMTNLQRDIYDKKYRYDGENFEGFIKRVSGDDDFIGKAIKDKKFMPAGRILAGRGLNKDGKKVTLSNCYVMPIVEDNIESIFDTAKYLARTYSYGGGCGINISKLRPKGAKVNNAASTTTGAVSFMDLFSMTTSLIGMRGRRGALMINMDVSHPDIEEFIDVKNDLSKVNSANISVNVNDEFLNAVKEGTDYTLNFDVEASGEQIRKNVDAKKLWRTLARNNWNMAEPGILYKDRINSWHIMSADPNFEYAGVNPCAEEPLPAWGSCNLSSINLGAFVKSPFTDYSRFDFDGFAEMVRAGVRYLNGVLDENEPLHPIKEQRELARDLRQIGLGIMGLADMFIKLKVRYGSPESIKLIHQIGRLMINEALKESALLSKEYGPFPLYNKEAVLASAFIRSNADDDTLELIKEYGLRNSQLLTIAPTGSISTLIGCSNGVEPIFQISYTRKTESIHGIDTYYKVYTEIVKQYMDKNNLFDEEELPDFIVTTSNLNYHERIDVQAAWQQYIDASISSTVNVPNEFTISEVEDLYLYAWEKGLKGITIYRDGCRRGGILITDNKKTDTERINELQEEINEIANKALQKDPDTCPVCGGKMNHSGGCAECQDCGYSPCAV